MIIEIIGFIGMFLILFAFIMNQLNKWDSNALIYDLFNSMGGLMLITYALMIKSYPFLILNVVWTVVSIKDVFMDLRKSF